MSLLPEERVSHWLTNHTAWRLEDGKLFLSLKFQDFSMAWGLCLGWPF